MADAFPSVREEMRRSIAKWEGGFQNYTWDPGNYVKMPNGARKLIGTVRGVTPNALATYLGMRPWEITPDFLRERVTLELAADMAERNYYQALRINRLPWGPATAVIVDIAWGSWTQAIKITQRLCGVFADGVIGPQTEDAYERWIASVGWEEACTQLHRARMAFYKALERQDPAQFGPPQPGWKRRSDWFLPTPGGEWWRHWQGNLPALPTVGEELPDVPHANVQPVNASPAPKPITKSKTAASVVVAAAGGVGSVVAENDTVKGTLMEALTQVPIAASMSGFIQYAFLGLVLGGAGYGLYRLWDDRRKSERVAG